MKLIPAAEMSIADLAEVLGQIAEMLETSLAQSLARPTDPGNAVQVAQAEIVNKVFGVVWDQKVQALRRAKELLLLKGGKERWQHEDLMGLKRIVLAVALSNGGEFRINAAAHATALGPLSDFEVRRYEDMNTREIVYKITQRPGPMSEELTEPA